MNSTLKLAFQILLAILMLAGIYFLGNLVPRSDFQSTLGLFVLLFGFLFLIFSMSDERTPWVFIFLAGLSFRFSLFLAIPQWSEDYTRFLWDGELLRLQENPYAETPRQFLENHPVEASVMLDQLFPLLNSPDYYSVYPPSNQVVFWLAAKASNGLIANGIISIRLILLLGEIAVFMLFIRLLNVFKLPQKLLFLYWLNPLVILEITGNLHFEGLVLLLLLAAVLALEKKKSPLAGGFWGLAVGMKLVPLILLPALVSFKKFRDSKLAWISVFLALVFSFGWFLMDSAFGNFLQSLKLYQGKFEFNASIYYLLREIGFWIEGYNTITYLTKGLSVLTLIVAVYFSWKRKPTTVLELVDLWVMIYLIYLMLQPVVHPWYILPAFGLSLLTKRNTFLIWTFAAIFSYQAYSSENILESPIFLGLEYLLVFGGIFIDYFLPKRKINFTQ